MIRLSGSEALLNFSEDWVVTTNIDHGRSQNAIVGKSGCSAVSCQTALLRLHREIAMNNLQVQITTAKALGPHNCPEKGNIYTSSVTHWSQQFAGSSVTDAAAGEFSGVGT